MFDQAGDSVTIKASRATHGKVLLEHLVADKGPRVERMLDWPYQAARSATSTHTPNWGLDRMTRAIPPLKRARKPSSLGMVIRASMRPL
jgi:hypothetical protein